MMLAPTNGGGDRFRGLVNRLLYTTQGQIVCSILFGFAFVLMFRKVCEGGNCKVILAPPLEHIQKTIFELEGDCYRYKPVPIQCPAATTTPIVPSDA